MFYLNAMAKHECNQIETINNLKTNQAVFMEKLDNLLDKTNWLEKTMTDFIKEIKDNYSTKQETNFLKEKVENHQAIISRISWAVILWVLAFAWSSVLLIYKTQW